MAKPQSNVWDPKTDPVVGPGPEGSGLHQTKSGRYVDSSGVYFTHPGKSQGQVTPSKGDKALAGKTFKNPLQGDITGAKTGDTGFNQRDPKDVRNLQEFLHNRGYEIGVDGKWGPQTEAAAAFFREHHTKNDAGAGAFNVSKVRAKAQDPAPTFAPPASKQRAGGPGSHGNGARQLQGDTSGGLMGLIASMMGGKDTSAADGLAATNAQYAAPIAESQRIISDQGKQDTSNMADIKNWFANLISANKSGNEADTAALNKVLGDSSGFMKNVLGSITDEAARAQVGIAGLNNENNLKGLGLAEGNFNRNMSDAYALTGRDAATSVASDASTRMNDMKQKLLDLITQRSDALVKNTNDARDSALGRKGESIKQFATLAMLQPNLDSAGLAAEYKKAQIDHLLHPPAKAPKMSSSGDITSASADAMKGIYEDDGSGNMVLKKYPSAGDLVRDVNLGFRSHGLSSTDPRVLAARNAILQKAGLTSIDPRWKF